jgi:hypothetical protein
MRMRAPNRTGTESSRTLAYGFAAFMDALTDEE